MLIEISIFFKFYKITLAINLNFSTTKLNMAKPRQIKGNRTDADVSHSIRNTIFTITTLPPRN
jgi:hypothetical protein